MGLSEITRESVLAAIAEYNQLGKAQFLEKYGFHVAKRYFLVLPNQEFPSKAIAGVAHKYVKAGNRALTSGEFNGGISTVVRKLEELGFHIKDKQNR